MMEIKLNTGEKVLVDAADYDIIKSYKWHRHVCRRTTYARAWVRLYDGSRKKIFLHNILMGRGHGKYVVDHINGNGLDNRRSNLQVTTLSHNTRKGVSCTDAKYYYFLSSRKRWHVQYNNSTNGGFFKTEKEAQTRVKELINQGEICPIR